MRIVCPSCTAAYEVPDRLLGAGKRLRCARCAHEWAPPEMAAPAPAPSPAAPPPPAPAEPPHPPVPIAIPPAEPRRAAPAPLRPEPALHADSKPRPANRARRPSRWPVLLALLASVLVLAGIAAAGVIWRAWVMHAFPPSRLLFQLLGLA